MRKTFFEELDKLMYDNPLVWAITGDLGYGGFDYISQRFPDRFINVGAAEQAGIDIAIGLSLSGKIPVFYTITPFLLRAYESLRTYINHEHIHIILIGSGRDIDYSDEGFSHHALDIGRLLDPLTHIAQIYPADKSQIEGILKTAVRTESPTFISLARV